MRLGFAACAIACGGRYHRTNRATSEKINKLLRNIVASQLRVWECVRVAGDGSTE